MNVRPRKEITGTHFMLMHRVQAFFTPTIEAWIHKKNATAVWRDMIRKLNFIFEKRNQNRARITDPYFGSSNVKCCILHNGAIRDHKKRCQNTASFSCPIFHRRNSKTSNQNVIKTSTPNAFSSVSKFSKNMGEEDLAEPIIQTRIRETMRHDELKFRNKLRQYYH